MGPDANEPDVSPLVEYGGGPGVERDDVGGGGEREGRGGPVADSVPEGPEAGIPWGKYFVRFCFAPIARRTMLSISPIVFVDTLTACPLIACTVESPFRVFSEVRTTSARGGRGGGTGVPLLLVVGVPLAWVPWFE